MRSKVPSKRAKSKAREIDVASLVSSISAECAAAKQKAPTIGEIAVACAIGYLDFRLPELNWRDTRPQLRAWYEGFSNYPAMQETQPANPP